MEIQNPHKPGSVTHTNFATHIAHYQQYSQPDLQDKHAKLSKEAGNFMRYSVAQMSTMDLEVDAISRVHHAKFGTAI